MLPLEGLDATVCTDETMEDVIRAQDVAIEEDATVESSEDDVEDLIDNDAEEGVRSGPNVPLAMDIAMADGAMTVRA